MANTSENTAYKTSHLHLPGGLVAGVSTGIYGDLNSTL